MYTIVYRKLVMPEDMNASGNLFGGRLLQWLDESAALYAICQMNSKNVVTLKVSEILFKKPVNIGDFLSFSAYTKKVGTTSLTIGIDVINKGIGKLAEDSIVLTCDFTFVKIDSITKLPTPHGLQNKEIV